MSYHVTRFVNSQLPNGLSQHILSMRFHTPSHETYESLRALVGDTPHFVLTSNVDGQFEKAGFDPHNIVTPQGD